MKVSELGEFGLIELLADIINKNRDTQSASWQKVIIGIGDDTAAWHEGDHIQLATTDSLVQGTHFNLNVTGWEELGWKAIAVNLSDIAAMGGVPQYALVSLVLPGTLEVDSIASLYRGMSQIANQFMVAIAGGNIASAEKVMINVTILGSLKDKFVLTRSAALPGDQIAVTGFLGASAAGIRMLKGKLCFDAETTKILKQAHLKPVPRVGEGQILLQCGVRTAIDISDGLLSDLTHICKASKVSARIEEKLVPIHPAVKANFKTDYQQLALAGGEDYELLFTAGKPVMTRVKQAVSCPVTIIGDITEGMPGQVTVIDTEGKSVPRQQAGWEHFKSRL